MREAHYKVPRNHGSLSMQEASLYVQGKPFIAGGPGSNIVVASLKPIHAAGHVEHAWEARPCGRPT